VLPFIVARVDGLILHVVADRAVARDEIAHGSSSRDRYRYGYWQRKG